MFHHFGFYHVRRPTKSINELFTFHQQLGHTPFEDLIKKWFEDHTVQQAIFIASPGFYERCKSWLDGKQISEKDQIMSSLYKYLIRMATRSTPYGLFACTAIGKIEESSQIVLEEKAPLELFIDINVQVQQILANYISSTPEAESLLKLYPNNTLYKVGDNYRYVEQIHGDAGPEYFISSVEDNCYLQDIFKMARTGITVVEINTFLQSHGYNSAESNEFTKDLLETTLLISDINPNLTGPTYLSLLHRKLLTFAFPKTLLDKINALIETLNGSGDLRTTTLKMQSELNTFIGQPVGPSILKVNSRFNTTKNQISEQVIKEITAMISSLTPLHQPRYSPDLEDFKRRFIKRYETEEVPLTFAIDHEAGIGYLNNEIMGIGETPLLQDLNLPFRSKAPDQVNEWWQTFILEKYTDAISKHVAEIELSDQDLNLIQHRRSNEAGNAQPSGIYLFGNILAETFEEVDSGNYLFNLLACQGPSAVNMLSRFGEGNQPLERKLQECTAMEEALHPEVIFAEIVCFPNSKAGNIMYRPNLYKHEIPYLGQSSVSDQYRIPLDDIMVSVRGNHIILRSKKRNKRIIPRLSNVHNFNTGLPVYRFLSELQYQDSDLNIHWDWGIVKKLAYLPRVRYKKIILSRQRWLLKSNDFAFDSIIELTKKLEDNSIPSKFAIAFSDNELFIDLKIPASVELFSQILRKHEILSLVEFLSDRNHFLKTPDLRSYNSEFVIPLFNKAVKQIPGLSILPPKDFDPEMFTEKDWLYFKIYIGEKSADSLLVHVLYPLMKDLHQKKLIKKFFFVRYHDPEPHLRFRIHLQSDPELFQLISKNIEGQLSYLLRSKVIDSLVKSTYKRELERYNWSNIEIYESLFSMDSAETLEFLTSNPQNSEHDRFEYALYKILALLKNAKYSIQNSRDLLEKINQHYFVEFKGNTFLKKGLNQKYKLYKQFIEKKYLEPQFENAQDYISLLASLHESENKNEIRFTAITSIIHMMINRIFNTNQRAYELILYHCLYKYFDSVIARIKIMNNHIS